MSTRPLPATRFVVGPDGRADGPQDRAQRQLLQAGDAQVEPLERDPLRCVMFGEGDGLGRLRAGGEAVQIEPARSVGGNAHAPKASACGCGRLLAIQNLRPAASPSLLMLEVTASSKPFFALLWPGFLRSASR